MSAVKPALYRVKDVMVRTSLSEREVRRLCEIGTFHRRYVGSGRKYYRVTVESVEAYLESLSSEKDAAG